MILCQIDLGEVDQDIQRRKDIAEHKEALVIFEVVVYYEPLHEGDDPRLVLERGNSTQFKTREMYTNACSESRYD